MGTRARPCLTALQPLLHRYYSHSHSLPAYALAPLTRTFAVAEPEGRPHWKKPHWTKPQWREDENFRNSGRRTRGYPVEMATEESVGILSYANSLPGFRGILKQRFSDFIVNEVDLGGNVTHLSDLEPPPQERIQLVKVSEETVVEATEAKEAKEAQSLNDEFSADVLAFKEIAGESNAKLLEDLLLQIANCKGEPVSPVLLAPDDDKNHRGTIHTFFKSRLTFLTTDTVDGPSSTEKCIRLRHSAGNQGGGGRGFQKRGREVGGRGRGRGWENKRQKINEGDSDQPYDARGSDGWPSERPKFLQFYLYKENKDTQDALTVIGRMLHVQPKNFGFAGTKDKRAITTQQVTVFKQSAAKMAALNQRLFGIKVGNFSYVDKSLVLGMLSGNRFTITLRGVVAENDSIVENAVKALGESGFINYFGLQRFGSGSIATHSVGAALLRGEWKAAASLILDPREGDQPEVKEAREYFKKSKNIDGALQRFPRYLTAERALLTYLKRDSKNYLQAINTIPRTLRLMYVHSYQSFLWNHAASHRAKTHGVDKVVVGDLVYDKDAHDTAEELDMPVAKIVDTSEVGVTDGALDDVVDADVPAVARNKIKCLTTEDVASGRYSVSDVLLPLPGGSTLYPANDTADVYRDLAQKDSVDLHTCTHNVKEFALPQLPGAYRLFLQKPVDLEWKILKYSDPTKALAETDLDRIQKKVPEEVTEEPKGSEVSEQTAAQLTFTLPASCYATMALRELMKISTSVAFHKTLNDEPAVTATATAKPT
ncbi:hypothetical protein KC19_11G062700 [Ceratodon purpureus]|uniref:TRUD domain-containing protein n=1 Tax=Ceratodon purpureus TaxID=3225 RepID=A0A8T0GHB3_CERPU|nr:hypothetical protein KC19_11G062700 [Ceratodon purpureus]